MKISPVRKVLAQNLAALMKSRPDLDTQIKVSVKAKIAQTSVSQMLRPDNPTARSPKLDQVEKIAEAFGLATWQLLIDQGTVGTQMADLLMRPAISDTAVEVHLPATPKSLKMSKAKT